MVVGTDIVILLLTTYTMICGQLGLNNFLVVMCTNSFLLYKCLVKLGTTKEKQLMINIMALWQLYKHCELAEIQWIKGDSNPANAMTKSKPNKCLKQLVLDNQLEI